MATAIKMPQLSDTMSSGKIIVWHKKEGDQITRGDILAEVETDKANLEIESFFSGTLLKINTPANSAAAVGEVIAFLGNPGEQIADVSATKPIAIQEVKEEVKAQVINIPSAVIANDSDRIKASPLAKKIAEQKSINLADVSGSGPNGRIIRKDLDGHNTTSIAKSAPSYEATPSIPAGGQLTALSKMRATIAQRMQQSVDESPHFYVTTSVNMTEAVKLRALLKPREDFKGISINHLVIKAAAYAIAHEPRVNRAMKNDQIFDPGEINIGIITAIDEGLLIPVLKQANKMSLKDLVFEARAAIERARTGRPSSSDLTGGTFSISNMGMYDVENFTAIINPGQGAIMAVGSMQDSAVVVDGKVVVAPVLKATVSADHRIIDGIISATFLKHFKKALENPALLLV